MNTLDTQSPHAAIIAATKWLGEKIIGQEALIERLMMALLCGGHLLVEGAPGLAKTRAIKELSELIEGDFHRIQFTLTFYPAMSPAQKSTGLKMAALIFSLGQFFTT